MGRAPKIKILDEFIENELVRIRNAAVQEEACRTDWKSLNQYFCNQIRRDLNGDL